MTSTSVKNTVTRLTYITILIFFLSHIPAIDAQNAQVSLLNAQRAWKPFGAAIVAQNQSSLDILVVTTNTTGGLWSRAYLPVRVIAPDNSPVNFTLEYSTQSYSGNASFIAEIRDNHSGFLFGGGLNNTGGELINKTFRLPVTVLNTPVEFRLYIQSEGPGEHSMIVKKAGLSFPNVTQPIQIEYL